MIQLKCYPSLIASSWLVYFLIMMCKSSEIPVTPCESNLASGCCFWLPCLTYHYCSLSLSLAIGSVPVINALSDLHHPLQALADLMTLQELFGELKGLTVTWIGDGCNVLHDLMLGCALLGVNVNLCCPPSFEPHQGVMKMAQKLASASGSRIMVIYLPFFISI